MPVYLYWGEEEFNLEREVRELRKKVLTPGFEMLAHKVLDEPDIKNLVDSIQAIPMIPGDMLVEVRTPTLFFRGKRKISTTDPLMKRLIEAVEKLDSRIHLLFVCPVERESGKKIDGTMKLTKTIQKIGKVVEYPAFKFYQEDQIINWIMKQASGKSLKISSDAAASLLQNIGSDLRKLDMELEKAEVAVHPRKTIGLDDVKEVFSANENVFLFAEYWLKQDKTQALCELNKLFEKNNPLKIAATLQTVTRRWLKIKLESQSKNSFEVSKAVNMPKFMVEKEIQKLRNIPEERLFKLRENLKATEYKIKSGQLAAEVAMEALVLS